MTHFIDTLELTLSQFHDIVHSSQASITLSEDGKKRIADCRKYLDDKITQSEANFYGINTGFGSLCDTRINSQDLRQLQINLMRSHACGTGAEVPQEVVKLMLLTKARSLAYGYSGVQVETVQRLLDCYNHNILPIVYTQGSLGASGDLSPLAHLCLPLIGEGEVYYKGVKMEASIAFEKADLSPIILQAKEGLALLNGTQFMLSYSIHCLWKSLDLWHLANRIAALSIDAFDARIEPFHHRLHDIRPHTGQILAAKQIRLLLADSEIAQRPKKQVQDPYSFRCIPQVHGATYDTLMFVQQTFETEFSSATDNPNIFAETDEILSGGNFHGQPLALALDYLAIAVAEMASISERRIFQLIAGKNGLPSFLTANAGINSGYMIPQYTAASIVSKNKQLCTPASVDSIPSSQNQEDHVSMGANAAVKCYEIVENVQTVLAIELLNASQALFFREPAQTGTAMKDLLAMCRKYVPFMEMDRYLHADIKAIRTILEQYRVQNLHMSVLNLDKWS